MRERAVEYDRRELPHLEFVSWGIKPFVLATVGISPFCVVIFFIIARRLSS